MNKEKEYSNGWNSYWLRFNTSDPHKKHFAMKGKKRGQHKGAFGKRSHA